MEFRLLGPVEARTTEGTPIELPRRQQRALLGILLIHAGEIVSTDRLVDDLWGERPPPSAIGSLQNTVWQLRKLLGAETVRTQPPGYVLDVGPDDVDVHRFERLLAESGAQPAAERAATLRDALSLWHGPALADLAHERWAEVEAGRLDALRLTALEGQLDAELDLGRHAVLVARLEALTAEHPLRERLWVQLALALYRSGRQADALEACRTIRDAHDRLGLEPSAELRQLERDILNQSETIGAPAVAAEVDTRLMPAAERRVVSALAIAVSADEDPERLRRELQTLVEVAQAGVEAHGGEIESLDADGLVATFGAAEAREDDALRAVRAAVAIHARTGAGAGVATAEALIGTLPRVAGAAVTRAAELAREQNGVLVDPRTHELVRGAVTTDESGASARIVTVSPARPTGGPESALVGREVELARVRALWDAVAAERRCRVLTVLGEPGIGKTRLAREAATGLDATLLVGRCAAYGEGATFLPIVEALRDVEAAAALGGGGEAELVASHIAGLAATSDVPRSMGETYWAIRRLLESVAAIRPTLLVLDDVHWAEPALLDLVEYLRDRIADSPVAVLCLARPELLEERPGWAAETLRLEPLGTDETRELVGATAELEDEARERIVELAEGNPLYAQQLATYAAESGKALEPGAMPATIEAVLAGRLGRLEAGERATLQRAAVVGREFSRGAVAALAPPDLAVDAHLLALTRRGFVLPLTDPLPGDDAYRFHHVLLRDAAYATLTKEQRADLHEKVAAWLDRDGPGDDALVGHHLEQAALYGNELGRTAHDLSTAAGERLASAGARAWARNDGWAAVGLVERAVRLLPAGATKAAARFEYAVIIHAQGRGPAAVEALEQALAEASGSGASAIEIRARLELARLAHARDELSSDELLELATKAISTLTALEDHRGLVRAWVAACTVHSYACRMEAMGHAAAQAFRHARLAGFSGQGPLGLRATALVCGPMPVDRALTEAVSLLELASDRAAEADVEAALAALHAMAGATDDARRLAEHARALYDDVGPLPLSLHSNLTPLLMEVERFSGDLDAVVALGNESVDALLSFGAGAYAATHALKVADVELGRDNLSEATRLLRIAKANAVANDVLGRFLECAIEARLLARTANSGRAGRLVREAGRIAGTTDAPVDQARVAVAAEEVARLGDDPDAARAAATEARRLWSAKGVRVVP